MAKYAFTDIHGNYNLWLAIKNYCKEDDEIFFLGDAIDRGPDGIKIMQELFKDKNRDILSDKVIEFYKLADQK